MTRNEARLAVSLASITAAMLPSRDALDVKLDDRGVSLREAAVFAPVSCAMSNQFTNRCVHQEDGC